MKKFQDGDDVYHSIHANYLFESEIKTNNQFSC